MRITHFTLGNEDDSGKITHDEKGIFSHISKISHIKQASCGLALLEYVLQMLLITGDCEHSVQIIESG